MSILKDLGVPIFKAGGMPTIDLTTYLLSVGGLVKEERLFSWQDILAMPKSQVNCRLTSVSGWSVRAVWEGIQNPKAYQRRRDYRILNSNFQIPNSK